MFFLRENIGLLIIFVCVFASLSAQIIKFFVSFIINKKWDCKKIFSTGGMPSSHSALVSSLTCLIGILKNFNSIEFAICFCFSLIVMHDAISVRRSVGIQAQRINNLSDTFCDIAKELSEIFTAEETFKLDEIKLDKIKELLGHSPFEVLIGALYGVCVSLVTTSIFNL